MSYFITDTTYIIVPKADVTNAMINNMKRHFYTSDTSCRENNDKTKCLFKVKLPISAAFDNYKWYNEDDIRVELQKAEWN